MLNIKAKRDGQVFYGFEKKGQWMNSFGSQLKKEHKLVKGMPLLSVLDDSSMQIKVALPYNKRNILDGAKFALSCNGLVFEAELVSCSDSPVNGALEAVFEVEGNQNLYQGSKASISIIRKTIDLRLISASSIKAEELTPWVKYVMVERDGKKIKAEVKLGESYNGKTVVISGIEVNDRVL